MQPNSDLPLQAEAPSRRRRGRPTNSERLLVVRKNRKRAQDVIDFIELLTVPSGIGKGKPFKLQPWQKEFIRAIYEPHRNGKRIVRRAILSLARKNGKTALIAAIALAHLVGPERELHGEIYSAANDRDQAAIVFKFAQQIVELEPELQELIEVVKSTKTMIARDTGSIYRAVSAEAGTKHGYSPSVVIFDELAQAKTRDLYDVLDTSFGAREEPLFIVISTQSNDPEHVLSKLIDDGLAGIDPSIVCHLHAAKEDCNLEDEAEWYKANPALGTFRDRDDFVLGIRKAIRMPAFEPSVRNLFLNQRVNPTSTLISRAEWSACAGQVSFEPQEDVYLGVDLSSVIDLTAVVMGSATDPCRVKSFFWKPEGLLLEQSNKDFGSGNRRYEEWRDAGWLNTTLGNSIDITAVATFIAELAATYRVVGLAYDAWRIGDLMREFDRIGLQSFKDTTEPQEFGKLPRGGDGLRVVPWGQGYRDMAPAIDALEHAIIERQVVHDSNPVLIWNLSNAVATMDSAGNRKLDKEKARFRIDGAVALAMMMGLRARDRGVSVIDIGALIG
jgi:phage terminase large subunit-like protein